MKKAHQKKLETMREKLADMREQLDAMTDIYRDKYDNATERWQASEAGAECDTDRENLELAAAEIESAESTLAGFC